MKRAPMSFTGKGWTLARLRTLNSFEKGKETVNAALDREQRLEARFYRESQRRLDRH